MFDRLGFSFIWIGGQSLKIYLGSQAVSRNSRGVARYFFDLFGGLKQMDVEVFRHPNAEARRVGFPVDTGGSGKKRLEPHLPLPGPLDGLAHDFQDWRLIRKLQADLVHLPYYPTGLAPSARLKTVVTLHDMIHQKYPSRFKTFDRGRRTKYGALQRADLIICVSETTRNDLVELWPEFAQESIVVRNGISLAGKSSRFASSLRRRVLYVGSRDRHKNFSLLAKAFGRLSRLNEFSDVELDIFGGPPLALRERRLLGSLAGSPDRIKVLQGRTQDLNAALDKATCLVCPSEYEGFGYTPLEAMNRGCPVVISDAAALTEISGPAASVFRLADPDGLFEKLRTLLASEEEQNRLSRLGLEHVKQYSVQRMASETLEAYKSI